MTRALLSLALAAAALAPHPAAAEKVVRLAFEIAETGFDPAQESDRYSSYVNEAIFGQPLTYDYLTSPARLVPYTLASMPEVSDRGATYVLRVRPGILFADDPAFDGKPRELTAEDYAYSIRRLYDPKNRSPVLFHVEGKIRGLDAVRKRALQGGRFDYAAPAGGLEVLDRYTLRIRLVRPDYTFLYVLATPSLGAVAREVVERYGETIRHHPVGTGPFRLAAYKPSSRIVLERNPRFRTPPPPPVPGDDDPEGQAIAAALAGKQLPIVDRVEISIIGEQQPRWLAFLNREHDLVENIAPEFVRTAAPGGKLAPSLARQGIQMWRLPEPELTLAGIYNMTDKVLGGYEPAKVALRRAINLAYDTPSDAAIARQGEVLVAEGVVPPGMAGHDPTFRGGGEHSPARAKALLDLFGYVDRDGDGWRDLPDGRPLVLEIASPPDQKTKQYDEVWHRSMTAVGIRITFRKENWPDLRKASRLGKLQIGSFYAWHADYPDAENFFQLLYGPNAGQSNDARFDLPEFDRLYEAALLLPDSPERNRIFARMNELVVAYAPWKLGFHRFRTHMAHPWVRNFRKHPILHHGWMYLDVDEAAASRPLARN